MVEYLKAWHADRVAEERQLVHHRFGLDSVAQIKAMSSAESLTHELRHATGRPAPGPQCRVLASVEETPHLAHVLFRWSFGELPEAFTRSDGAAWAMIAVASLWKVDGDWKVVLPPYGDLALPGLGQSQVVSSPTAQ